MNTLANTPSLDANKKTLAKGDRVHVLGRADRILYITELKGENADCSYEKDGEVSYLLVCKKLVKFKKQ